MNALKALIIDDEEDTCLLLGSILRQRKIDTVFAQSVAEAKTALKHDTPDVIFLDNHLKDDLGINLIPAILFEHPDSKIILMTAYDTFGDRDAAFKKGAQYFIGKPFTRRSISDALQSVFT